MPGWRSCSAARRSPITAPMPAGGAGEVLGAHDFDGGQRSRARHRVAAVGSAQTADVDPVHDLGPAGHRGQRQAGGDALGRRHQVRHDGLVLAGEPGPRPAEAGLHLVGHEQDPVVLAPLGHRR